MPTKVTKAAKAATTPAERDSAFILDPDRWPKWPVLPLKRRGYAAHEVQHFCGFLVHFDKRLGPPFNVYLGTIYSIRAADTWSEALAEFPMEIFASIDDLVKEWTVD